MDRKEILLKATYDILKKCYESPCVEDVMCTTAIWDDAECDGFCLMEEIAEELGLEALEGQIMESKFEKFLRNILHNGEGFAVVEDGEFKEVSREEVFKSPDEIWPDEQEKKEGQR